MRVIILLLALCLLTSPGLCIQIVEFYPDTYLPQDADEYLVIEGTGSLDGITISDGEGGFRFPSGTLMKDQITIARGGTAYVQVHGTVPEYELYDTTPEIPDVIRGGRFQMSNTEDELFLYENGVLAQTVSWPEDCTAREGQVHFLEDGRWDPRPLLLGQSRFAPITVENVTLTAFVSPDGSYSVYSRAITEAENTLRVNVYELSGSAIAPLLVRAQEKGVDVSLLLEGGPVGGITREEQCALHLLDEKGIPLWVMVNNGTNHAKYRFNHAKYVIIDHSGVLLSSENFNDNGFPLPERGGNRGWGVYLQDPRLAGYFQDVFSWDSQGNDIIPFHPQDLTCANPELTAYPVEFPPGEFTGARVTTVLAPDSSVLIQQMIARAQKSVDIEQAYIKNYSGPAPNPYLQEAIDAARRGVVVRILLDSSWFNVNEPKDNDEMVAYINSLGVRERIPISARCANLEGNNLEKIHTKGVIVDGNEVLVSSINWNEQSPLFNREAGVIIEHAGVGAYYRAAFEDDWNASDAATPQRDIDLAKLAIALFVIFGLLGLYLFRIRR